MSVLRKAIILYGILTLIGGILLLTRHTAVPLAFYFAANGVVILASILLERWHYAPRVDRTGVGWEETNERFIDPTTGRLVEVRYNRLTGERQYVGAGR